ncbi:hypothetical protein GGQ87_000441 [Brevundimonas alba]|uniref:Uncharacterized protein n=1 Tax=Brevundimonas alba TaxID=74314 RepID=A0A7X5YI48_9CAUL|nr:hypothetical protein [Brevundimonas alba]NJC40183.1 hypothetical protein [Brevundimonas alba]
MKKALIPLLAIAAASVAVPAAAQNYDRHDRGDRYEQNRGDRYEQNYGNWQSISQRKYQLDRRIDNGLRNGALSRREATRLKSELNTLVRLERSYMRGGLTRAERSDLDRRYDRLAVQVRAERRDRDNRRY